jgi:hypothetical protein
MKRSTSQTALNLIPCMDQVMLPIRDNQEELILERSFWDDSHGPISSPPTAMNMSRSNNFSIINSTATVCGNDRNLPYRNEARNRH